MIATEAVAGFDVAKLDVGARHAKHKVRQQTAGFSSFKV